MDSMILVVIASSILLYEISAHTTTSRHGRLDNDLVGINFSDVHTCWIWVVSILVWWVAVEFVRLDVRKPSWLCIWLLSNTARDVATETGATRLNASVASIRRAIYWMISVFWILHSIQNVGPFELHLGCSLVFFLFEDERIDINIFKALLLISLPHLRLFEGLRVWLGWFRRLLRTFSHLFYQLQFVGYFNFTWVSQNGPWVRSCPTFCDSDLIVLL